MRVAVMTQTSTAGPPGILDEIEALFSWNPPRLAVIPKMKIQMKTSAATRQPTFYDKHFSPDLVVKNVVPLPSLVQDLAKNVDKALDAALGTLPPVNFLDFITVQQRAGDIYRIPRTVTNKKAVGDFYLQTTARYCQWSSVTSMLALHPVSCIGHNLQLLQVTQLWTGSSASSQTPVMSSKWN